MSGRIHELITAENFAKWAEEQERIEHDTSGGSGCAIGQWLKSLGFPAPAVSTSAWSPTGDLGTCKFTVLRWISPVTAAYDSGQCSGPVLAKIARDSA